MSPTQQKNSADDAVFSFPHGHSGVVWSTAWSPDGTRVVTGGEDGDVRFWELATGERDRHLLEKVQLGAVRSVAWSPDGSRVVSGGGDGRVQLWNAATGVRADYGWDMYTGVVLSVAWSPDGSQVVSGGDDGRVRLWDAATGEQIRDEWEGHTGSVRSVAWSPDGYRVVSGGDDGRVRLWDATTGQQVGDDWEGHTAAVWSVAWSPDGYRVVSGGDDGRVRLWDATTGQQVGNEWDGHAGLVWSVAWSPDGAHVVTGGGNGRVRLWDATTGQQVGNEWDGHRGAVWSVEWSPDGDRVLVGGQAPDLVILRTPGAFFPQNDNDKAPRYARNTRITADVGASPDELGRVLLADHLNFTTHQLLSEPPSATTESRSHIAGSATTVVSLDGAWGTGKTWLAHQATARMDNEGTLPKHGGLAPPVVVDFDCWRESKVSPEWWSLANAIRSAVVAERSWPSQAAVTITSMFARWWSSPVTRFVGILVALAAVTGLLRADFTPFMTWWSVVVGAVVALVAVGRALFWSAPLFGKLHLRTDDNPMSDIARMVAHMRAWSPQPGISHRIADATLTSILGLLLFHAALVLRDNGYQPPGLSIYRHLDRPWVWGLVVCLAFVATGLAAAPIHSRHLQDVQRTRLLWGQTIGAGILGCSYIVFFANSAVSRLLTLVSKVAPGSWGSPHALVLAVLAALAMLSVGIHARLRFKNRNKPRRPIVLILDELDRCETTSVVRYLETVHTIIRHSAGKSLFRLWAAPAPLIVLALADGKWVREAFTTHYDDFAKGNDPTKELGANFIQKLFDHTILVPELSAGQVQRMVNTATHFGYGKPVRTPAPATPARTPAAAKSSRAEQQPVTDSKGDDMLLGADGWSPSSLDIQREQLRKDADPEEIRRKEQHLLTQYVEYMPSNPRMIRRTVNAWAMLQVLKQHLGHKHGDEPLVRAALFLTRFPSLTDWLRTTRTPPELTNDGTVVASRWSPELPELAACFGRADVLHVLRWTESQDGQTYMQPRTLGECLGVVYAPLPDDTRPSGGGEDAKQSVDVRDSPPRPADPTGETEAVTPEN